MVNRIDSHTILFWFRRDLRLSDNVGLYHALSGNTNVLPIFIFDKLILEQLEDETDRRVAFIYQSVLALKQELEKLGSSLLVVHSTPTTFFKTNSPKSVYTNNDYEPFAKKRDLEVSNILNKKGIDFHTFKDHVIFEKNEIQKDDGKPYIVFTPYAKKWKANLKPIHYKEYSVEKNAASFIKITPLPIPSLYDIGFKDVEVKFPLKQIKTTIIENYDKRRNFPAVEGTTKLSVHLRFGTVSIRKLVSLALKHNEVWLKELIWREFYQMILWHFPNIDKAFKPAYDHIQWRNNPTEFEKWCNGQTGYPIVDAGMRELNATGFMHNRVRMIVASFLTKHLLIDWRWGEAYFASKLLDFDLAANNGGWQWAAGSGCDAAPYFRVFNPYIQTDNFDPELKYVRKWVPELDSPAYPKPIVPHNTARERALRTYKEALRNN